MVNITNGPPHSGINESPIINRCFAWRPSLDLDYFGQQYNTIKKTDHIIQSSIPCNSTLFKLFEMKYECTGQTNEYTENCDAQPKTYHITGYSQQIRKHTPSKGYAY